MEDPLESEEFYNLMQRYRHFPIERQDLVIAAFEDVKAWIREYCVSTSDTAPQGSEGEK